MFPPLHAEVSAGAPRGAPHGALGASAYRFCVASSDQAQSAHNVRPSQRPCRRARQSAAPKSPSARARPTKSNESMRGVDHPARRLASRVVPVMSVLRRAMAWPTVIVYRAAGRTRLMPINVAARKAP